MNVHNIKMNKSRHHPHIIRKKRPWLPPHPAAAREVTLSEIERFQKLAVDRESRVKVREKATSGRDATFFDVNLSSMDTRGNRGNGLKKAEGT